MSAQVVVLSDQQLQTIAALVVDEMEARQAIVGKTSEATAAESVLVDAAELGRRLGLSRSTVYERSRELGAIEVGRGDRPRLRFDPEKALEAWTHRQAGRRSQESASPAPAGVSRRRRSPSLGSGVRLLPVKDRSAPPGARARAER